MIANLLLWKQAYMIIFSVSAVLLATGYSVDINNIYFLVGTKRINIVAINRNGYNYIHAESIKYLFNEKDHVTVPDITGFWPVRDLPELLGIRINWVASRNTFIVDTTPNYIPTEPIFTAEPLSADIIDIITGISFHEHTHFGHDYLAYLTLTHIDFYGNRRLGHMIVANEIAQEVLEIFQEIYEAAWPIERIRLIDFYGGIDYYSMHDNNSVGFNYRTIAGSNSLSRHALGMAIDINPIQNPYQRGDTIWPPAGEPYLDRTNVRPGMIIPGDPLYNAFITRGWVWGGNWIVPRDYHHFERR